MVVFSTGKWPIFWRLSNISQNRASQLSTRKRSGEYATSVITEISSSSSVAGCVGLSRRDKDLRRNVDSILSLSKP